ncbi:NCS2 family permease [Clostridium isatidis]|uniref:Guanine permease n=1 Tax=Clostridium isatidis TaxID=182773 RepID=A0A343J8Y9_9CLOT|nr:NCS2 family permease [Clostridium isatidis]ASW41997.1 guanine permease [Clostridium isatidis]NLZ33997.1 NCS2 family permease [Clostridiales bacterium]
MEKFFKLKENGTDLKTELSAGLTTFLTMAYILFVNPSMLSLTGMDKGAVFVATILASAIGTLVMGLVANVPFAQAPGMGLNALFTFTVVLGLGFTWQQALAMVFICGIINIIITTTKLRKMIIQAIPESLQYAISGGIGLFIAYLGLKSARFINFTVEPANAIAEGAVYFDAVPSLTVFKDPVAVLALIGLIITIILMLLNVKGSILIGIILTTIIGIFNGVTQVPDFSSIDFGVPSLSPTFLKLDIAGLFSDPSKIFLVLTTIFSFSLSDTFDTIGTFLGTGRKAGIFDAEDEKLFNEGVGSKSRLDKALFADAIATSTGALLGTSNTTTYVESAAGIGQGGRTGLTSVTVAVLFLLSLFLSPIIGMVPGAATAPALIVVGVLMMDSIKNIEWGEFEVAVPAFLVVTFMPFTFSITNGIAAGFIGYCIVKIFKKEAKDVHPIMYIVTLLFLLNSFIQALS